MGGPVMPDSQQMGKCFHWLLSPGKKGVRRGGADTSILEASALT